MNRESKTLSTADLTNVGTQSPESIADQPRTGAAGSPFGLDPLRRRDDGTEEEAVAAEAQTIPTKALEAPPSGAPIENVTAPLFERGDAEGLRTRWNEIQVGFVDEPRSAVVQADSLVAETIKRLADSFATGRQRLESEWDREGDVSTETLRLALQRYRSFFNRLLAI